MSDQPVVPDYDLLRRIGGGAYGDVWLARSRATGAMRAAKIVWRHRFEDNRPFEREFKGIQKFERISREHPSQLALFHIGRNDPEGYFYYVMELADSLSAECGVRSAGCEGSGDGAQSYVPHTLRADLEQGRLPAAKLLEIGLALAEALGHLHRHGLVHRDVKPSNVILVNGRPKLADIGLVTDASDQCSIVGTEGYLPPEGPGTPQADIFALGKVLYEAATGMDRRQFADLPPGLKSWPDAGSVLEINQVVLKACAEELKARYQSADGIQADLARLVAGKSVLLARRSAQRLGLVRRGAAWITVGAAVMGLLVLAKHALYPASAHYVGRPSTNSAAQVDYERGKTYLDEFTSNGLAQAAACFQEATQKDTNFAAAYGYLAVVYSWWTSDGWNPDCRELPKAKALAERALELDHSLAEPHVALGAYYMNKDWNWTGAETEYKKALQRNRSSLCRVGYCEFLRASGQMDEALAQLKEARADDSHSRLINQRFASYLRDARQFTNALAEIDTIDAMGVSNRMASIKANTLCALGRYPDAIDVERQIIAAQSPSDPRLREYDRLKAMVEFGNTNAYWEMKLKDAPNDYDRACCYAQLGKTNDAWQALGDAALKTNLWLTFWVKNDWRLDKLRSDLRFGELLKRMNLQ